jgi:hypothetical protein
MFPAVAMAAALLVPTALSAETPGAGQGCQFSLGFKTLHDLAPADVGDCIDNSAYQPNGDAQQHTTKGLMVWRKADNWTAFTNGYMTWINGPGGLVSRLNSNRFSWEATPPLAVSPIDVLPSPTPTAVPATPTPVATAKPAYAWYVKKVTDPPIQMCGYAGAAFACVDSAINEANQYIGGHAIHKDGTPASGMIVQARVGKDPNSPLLFNTTTDDGSFGIVFGIGCNTGPLGIDVFLVDADLKISSPIQHVDYQDCHRAGEFHFDFMEAGSP